MSKSHCLKSYCLLRTPFSQHCFLMTLLVVVWIGLELLVGNLDASAASPRKAWTVSAEQRADIEAFLAARDAPKEQQLWAALATVYPMNRPMVLASSSGADDTLAQAFQRWATEINALVIVDPEFLPIGIQYDSSNDETFDAANSDMFGREMRFDRHERVSTVIFNQTLLDITRGHSVSHILNRLQESLLTPGGRVIIGCERLHKVPGHGGRGPSRLFLSGDAILQFVKSQDFRRVETFYSHGKRNPGRAIITAVTSTSRAANNRQLP